MSVLQTPVLLGLAAVVLVLAAARAQQLWPAHGACPRCGTGTAAIAGRGPVRWIERWFHRRWCPSCSWLGTARSGPGADTPGPVAHGSGFRWSDAKGSPDGVFRWAPPPPPPGAPAEPPPVHASGFHWGAPPRTRREKEPAAFRWRRS